MNMDGANWPVSDRIAFLESFAYPGEIPMLAELARRFLNPPTRVDDSDALGLAILPLADALSDSGYNWYPFIGIERQEDWTVLDFAYAALAEVGPEDWSVRTWRAVAELPYSEVQRLIRCAQEADS